MEGLQAAYDFYSDKLLGLMKEVYETKKLLNKLATDIGIDIPYPDTK